MKQRYMKWIWIIIGVMVVGALLRFLWPMMFGYNYYPYGGHMMGGWGFSLGMFGMGAFWLIIIVLAFQYFASDKQDGDDHELSILKKRLSRGEITIDEFDRLKEKIKE